MGSTKVIVESVQKKTFSSSGLHIFELGVGDQRVLKGKTKEKLVWFFFFDTESKLILYDE